MLASATAGIISRIICHPLDTCKVGTPCCAVLCCDGALPSVRLDGPTRPLADPPIPTTTTKKARLQNPGSEFKSTWQVVQQTLRHEGVSGLYRGLGTVVSIGTPAFVLYLATYERTKRALCAAPALAEYQFVGHFVAGMTAETVRCVGARACVGAWVGVSIACEVSAAGMAWSPGSHHQP